MSERLIPLESEVGHVKEMFYEFRDLMKESAENMKGAEENIIRVSKDHEAHVNLMRSQLGNGTKQFEKISKNIKWINVKVYSALVGVVLLLLPIVLFLSAKFQWEFLDFIKSFIPRVG